jgi:hypothetical protein
MDHLRRIRIFLSSPGDVSQERTLAQGVIEALNHDPLVREKVVLRAVAWDKHDSRTPMMATLTPQEALRQGLPTPADCDIVAVILWSRIGTPLPAAYTKPDGGRYQSGTEYEYENARAGAKASKERGDHPIRPQLLIYRRTEKVTFDPDDLKFEEKVEQHRRVKAFFAQFTAPDGSLIGGVNEYATPDDFRADFENDLKFLLNDLMHAPTVSPPPEPPAPERWQGSPFPGLRALMPDDAPIFFGCGRDRSAFASCASAPRSSNTAVPRPSLSSAPLSLHKVIRLSASPHP